MHLRVLVITLPLLGFESAGAVAQQTLLATAASTPYDEVANCLMKQMAPRLTAVPVVRPPPANQAEVYLYINGTRETAPPVASFWVRQQGNGSTISFEEHGDRRGQYIAAATAAAKRCAR